MSCHSILSTSWRFWRKREKDVSLIFKTMMQGKTSVSPCNLVLAEIEPEYLFSVFGRRLVQCYWSSLLQISVPYYGADRRPLCVPAPGAQFTFTQPLFAVFADGRTDGPAGAEASGKRRLNLDKNASSLGGRGGATCSHQTNKAPGIKFKADVLINMMATLHF